MRLYRQPIMPKLITDLHIHSHFSRATSRDLTFEHLSKWAQLKGVQVVGTGDIAHPGWLAEMKEKLEPAEAGLFRLKAEYAQPIQSALPAACQAPVRFLLAGEVSNIYKKNGRVRKIHHLLFAPSLAAVEKLQAALEKIGNIRSDGRPILGLDSRDLLEIVLETDPAAYLIPAHIWTPWFAILGSMSGFDAIEECFDELTPHIFAVETGLSSDPPMNWLVSALDRYTLVSNSDAHSPQKLAREATVVDAEMTYSGIFAALKTGGEAVSTLEFFPEEGKYHYDGHRKCNIQWTPATTQAHAGICSVCGKPVTVGVMHRVATLADRKAGEQPARVQRFYNLIPLPEVLGEVYGVGAGSKQVQQQYVALLGKLGSELAILQDIPLEIIAQTGGALLAEGIRRMRSGELTIDAGYDGEYGVIKLFDDQERAVSSAQIGLFGAEKTPRATKKKSSATAEDQPGHDTSAVWAEGDMFAAVDSGEAAAEDVALLRLDSISASIDTGPLASSAATSQAIALKEFLAGLNDQQQAAVQVIDAPLLIVAGPGTGKTRTLTYRIAYLITYKNVPPEQILAITFTNKAAEEMAQRLTVLLGPMVAERITIKTFHSFGALLLRQMGAQIGLSPTFVIGSEDDRYELFKQCYPDWSEKTRQQALDQISTAKNQLLTPATLPTADGNLVALPLAAIYRTYEAALRQNQMLDFDDLLLQTVQLLETHPEVLRQVQARFQWISVDEYQDINLAQYRLLQMLTAAGANLCAIGDPDQAIYGFRGADRGYFLRFEQDFPTATRLYLRQNYRSTQLILDASTQVIAKESNRAAQLIWSETLDPTKVDIYPAPTDKAEAEYVVHQIEQMVGGTSYFSLDTGRATGVETGARAFADFAVLYRLRAQSRLLVEAFERSGIPYQTVGQTALIEHKEIGEILAYLWLVYNPLATFQHVQIFNAAASKRQKSKIPTFLRNLQATRAVATVVEQIEMIQQFLAKGLDRKFDDKQNERVGQLIRRATPFANRLGDFLETTALQKESDLYDPRADRVTLMSLHAAKGLEFPVVFMVGCEENLLPYQVANRPTDLDEERRLFYVGMTRAQQKLIFTHAKTRFLFGQQVQNTPSHFLSDIEDAIKEMKAMAQRSAGKEKAGLEQLTLF